MMHLVAIWSPIQLDSILCGIKPSNLLMKEQNLLILHCSNGCIGRGFRESFLEMKNEGRISSTNVLIRDESKRNGIQGNQSTQDHQGSTTWKLSEEEMDEEISELISELDFANRRGDVYHLNLLSVLKDIEDHKRELALKVQNVKLSLREGF